ncbi:MAG: hypothetical protein COT22_02825, partial [Ignavibacteria bacterium CG08_land_8_20_14_0_20_37_9]
MILKKLYLDPDSPFEPVVFKPGINFIFGKKEVEEGNEKFSLNGIGKSTFLDLIDFALLSSFTKKNSKRLYAAYDKGILKNKSVVLEFEVENKRYLITRAFDEPNKATLTTPKLINESAIQNLDDVKKTLCDLIFKRDKYPGYFSNTWLRKLIPFYIKIQKSKRGRMFDPIKYISEATEVELNQYHFFLLNIDNTLANKNFKIQTDLKRLKPTIKELSNFISESYNVPNIDEAQKRINSLQVEIKKLESSINLFRLSHQYKLSEDKADNLTADIKTLWFENNADEKKIESYRNSLRNDISIKAGAVKRIYEDLNSLLAENIKKTLQEAIDFRKQLLSSRKEFIAKEINKLQENIEQRNKRISENETTRSEIFKILAAQKAITDLTEAYAELDRKRVEAATLQAKIQVYLDLSKEKNEIQQEESKIVSEIFTFKALIQKQEIDFASVLISVYEYLYPEIKDIDPFSIIPKQNTNSKIEFSILSSTKANSEGIGRGRILVYDLSVLFYSIQQNYKAPRFIIHDGIFDGMDKSHFIKCCLYLEEKLFEGNNFQYIISLNEEGTLNQNFGETDKINTEKILKEAIL